MAPTGHSRFSPSASSRWLNCPGSIDAIDKLGIGGGKESIHSLRGTAAHALMEACLRLDLPPEFFVGKVFGEGIVADKDMVDGVGYAINYVNEYTRKVPDAKVHIEYQVNVGIGLKQTDPESFGTADIIIDAYQCATVDEIVVVDYKNGAGIVVEVEENSQMLLYTLGYRSEKKRIPATFRNVIIQPNAPHRDGPVREWVYDNAELNAFAAVAREAAAKTFETRRPEFNAGPWCKKSFCPLIARCPAASRAATERAMQVFKPLGTGGRRNAAPFARADAKLLTDADLAEALVIVPLVQEWCKEVQQEALRVLLAGRKLPGHKLVRGKSPPRQWSVDEKVALALLRKFLPIDVAAPRSVLSPTQAEKALTAAKVNYEKTAGKIVTRGQPSFHVAPEDDPREAAAPATLVFKPLEKRNGKAAPASRR